MQNYYDRNIDWNRNLVEFGNQKIISSHPVLVPHSSTFTVFRTSTLKRKIYVSFFSLYGTVVGKVKVTKPE